MKLSRRSFLAGSGAALAAVAAGIPLRSVPLVDEPMSALVPDQFAPRWTGEYQRVRYYPSAYRDSLAAEFGLFDATNGEFLARTVMLPGSYSEITIPRTVSVVIKQISGFPTQLSQRLIRLYAADSLRMDYDVRDEYGNALA